MKPTPSRLFIAALAALAFSTPPAPAQAAVFKDAQLESLHATGQFAALEQQAQARLKANPADAEARAALALALGLADPSNAQRLEAGAEQAQRCTEQHPSVAVCHLAAAQILGQQMVAMGMVKAMRSVGTLKGLWIRALELDPGSFTARVELAKLYLTVPGMLGGGSSKAQALEAAVRSSQPETARILRVHIAAEAKQWAEMEAELSALKGAKDAALQDEVREATMRLALVHLKDGKNLPKAQALYEALQRDQPGRAAGFYGAARVQAALGHLDEAVRLFERAKALAGADDHPIDQRLGDALLAKGDKAQAKAAYQRFVANPRAKPGNVEEARKALAQLG